MLLTIQKYIRVYYLVSAILLLFSLLSCAQNKSDYSDELALKILVKRVNFDENKSAKAKNHIVNDKIYVWDLWEPVVYKDSINWLSNPYENRSWYLYFQSLRMVGFLAQDYKYSKDSINITKSNEIIRSWHKTYQNDFLVEDNSKLSKKVWNDHAVANRVLNLMHAYFTFTNDLELRRLIKEILYYHGVWLANSKNYTKGNHAIMMDRALLQLSQLFSYPVSYQWEEVSKKRLEEIFNEEVTAEGVCTENSAGYHNYVLDLLIDSINLFKSYEIDYEKGWDTKVKKMKYFADQMLKPNNTWPTIGDTYYSNYPVNIFSKYKDSTFLYNSTFTNSGESFKFEDKVYSKSGYAFFKEKIKYLDSISYVNRTYLSLINTNLSPVHKHNDFLSITLTSNNEDLIIDAGHISYEKNDYTKYIRSAFAHNTLIINDKEFNFKEYTPEQLQIVDSDINKDYSYVRARFILGDTSIVDRSIVFIQPNQVLLYDKVIQENGLNSFTQIFNLGNTFKTLNKVDDNLNELVFKKNKLRVNQLNQTNYKLLSSDYQQNQLKGLRANGYGKIKDGKMLQYSLIANDNTVKSLSFITLVTIENKRFINKLAKIQVDNSSLNIIKDDKVIKSLKL